MSADLTCIRRGKIFKHNSKFRLWIFQEDTDRANTAVKHHTSDDFVYPFIGTNLNSVWYNDKYYFKLLGGTEGQIIQPYKRLHDNPYVPKYVDCWNVSPHLHILKITKVPGATINRAEFKLDTPDQQRRYYNMIQQAFATLDVIREKRMYLWDLINPKNILIDTKSAIIYFIDLDSIVENYDNRSSEREQSLDKLFLVKHLLLLISTELRCTFRMKENIFFEDMIAILKEFLAEQLKLYESDKTHLMYKILTFLQNKF